MTAHIQDVPIRKVREPKFRAREPILSSRENDKKFSKLHAQKREGPRFPTSMHSGGIRDLRKNTLSRFSFAIFVVFS